MPTLKEISISYSAAMKASLPKNRFENGQIHISRSETYTVSEDEDANEFYRIRYEEIQAEIGNLVVSKYNQIKDGEI